MDQYFEDEEITIDLSKYFKRLKEHWKTILRWGVAAFVIGCVVAVCTPRKFTVTSKLAPELSTTATSRLSSMASLVGLSATMLGTTDAVYPMVYPDIVESPEFLADLFDVPVSFNCKRERVDTTLYAYLTGYQKVSPIGAVISLPFKLIGLVMDAFDAEEKQSESEAVDPFHFTREQGKVVRMLGKNIVTAIDKKTLVVSTSVTMQDAEVCAQVSRAVNENLKSYVTAYRTQKAVKDCKYYEKLHEDARNTYYAAQRAYSNYTDSHQNVSLRSSMIESERLRNEATLKYQLYTSTAQQLQAAQAKVQQETPVFAEIVPPSVPLKAANSRKKTALAFAFLGLCAGVVWVLYKYRDRDEKIQHDGKIL